MDSRAHSWPCRQVPPGFQLTPTYWHKNLSYEHVLTFGVSRRKCISTTLRVACSLCPPISIFWPFFLILPPLLEYWKKFSPPPPKAAEIFSKFSHFFKFFHKNSIFLRLPPKKKLKKFSPRKNFPPQFTVSKWFSYPHLWFHQEGFSSPLKNFNNFSPGENLSPPIRPPTCACMICGSTGPSDQIGEL